MAETSFERESDAKDPPTHPTHPPTPPPTQACHYHGFSMATASRAVCLADAAAAAIGYGAPHTHAARALPPPPPRRRRPHHRGKTG